MAISGTLLRLSLWIDGLQMAGQPSSIPKLRQWLSTAFCLLLAISWLALLRDILRFNESGKLALAHQQVDPSWLPSDWYLSIPQSYQWLFQQIAGFLVVELHDPIAAIVIRLLGYACLSLALARVALQLQLSPLLITLAVVLFAHDQSVIAGEWMIGSSEPKTFAYAALLMAYALWRERCWAWSGLLLGLACSFHVLVGIYGASALAVLVLARFRGSWNLQAWCRGSLAFGFPALALSPTFIERLNGPAAEAPLFGKGAGVEPSAEFIYVYLRNPHHLVPATWTGHQWLHAVALLMLFSGAAMLCLRSDWRRPGFPSMACADLILWTLATALFALLGLIISPLDHNGTFLKAYLFRVPDTLVVLVSWLLLLRGLPVRFVRVWPAALLMLLLVIGGAWAPWGPAFSESLANRFTSSPEQLELYVWLRDLPHHDRLILTPPSDFEDLSNQARQPKLVQFKQVPTGSAAILTWYHRLTALAGGDHQVWKGAGGFEALQRLNRAYDGLDAAAMTSLAVDQRAGVVVTRAGHPGPNAWHKGFSNSRWSAWLPPRVADAQSGPMEG